MFLWMCVMVAIVAKVGMPTWVSLLVVAGYLWHLSIVYGGDKK